MTAYQIDRVGAHDRRGVTFYFWRNVDVSAATGQAELNVNDNLVPYPAYHSILLGYRVIGGGDETGVILRPSPGFSDDAGGIIVVVANSAVGQVTDAIPWDIMEITSGSTSTYGGNRIRPNLTTGTTDPTCVMDIVMVFIPLTTTVDSGGRFS